MDRYFFFNKTANQVLELQAEDLRDNGDRLVLRVGGDVVGELQKDSFAGWVKKAALPTIYSPGPGDPNDDED